MGSAPVESRLRELLLPPPMLGLKMGVVGTTAALTVAAQEKKITDGSGGCGEVFRRIQAPSALSEPQRIFPLLPHPTTVSSHGQQASQGDRADPAGLWGNVPGRGTSWVPSEGGMVKPDSQMGEFAP